MRQRPDADQVKKLDARYGSGVLLQTLLHYAQIGHNPEWLAQFFQYELQKIYSGSIIPTPFQTEGCVRAQLAESTVLDIETGLASVPKPVT